MEKDVQYLVNWLRRKVKDANMNGLLVGVSGGLDSAVVAYLIKQAFPDDSLGVILPVKSHSSDREDALKVIESAKIKHIEIDLTNAHQMLFEAVNAELKMKKELNTEKLRIGDANLRARLRMSALYMLANNYGYLVSGTDNAAEWYTGYFTKYGDGGVDLNPLVHYTKKQVQEMATFLRVPEIVINKPPSAGLWEGQTDENEMGTSYAMIDAFLIGKEISTRDQAIIEKLHLQSNHKRELAAIPNRRPEDSSQMPDKKK